ncbi:glycosyltransferase [Natronorubrum texcoconense]|uniref:Glycosyltransferase like family 2 n=1 Tax=Natronorubrum texcoconense TaxID=1095776 RepID=A0A1G8WQ45_9EURY|nr:glycosyltransferase [Natronorubrum texcoconense]SDJ80509.1 Glycosyltransferase like family 2 [Natronorubrum texcoconense]
MNRYLINESALESFVDEGDESVLPDISVIIPVYDNPDGIRKTVTSVAAATYETVGIHTVVTPADGETEAELGVLSESIDEVTVHTETDYETPGSARNVAIEEATGDVILFTDADMTIEKNGLLKIAGLFAARDADYVGFPVDIVREGAAETVAGWYDSHIRFPVEAFMTRYGFCPTCSLAVRNGVFETGLRFNPTLDAGEDVVFGVEVSALGFETGFCPNVTLTHPARESLLEVVTKGCKSGTGLYQLDAQYGSIVGEGSRLRDSSAYLPAPRSVLRSKCREWESLSPLHKALIALLYYVEILSRTGGYARAALGGEDRELPEQIRTWYEQVGLDAK